MGLKTLGFGTIIGASLIYWLDPMQGEKRRAHLKRELGHWRERLTSVMQELDASTGIRSKLAQAAEEIVTRTDIDDRRLQALAQGEWPREASWAAGLVAAGVYRQVFGKLVPVQLVLAALPIALIARSVRQEMADEGEGSLSIENLGVPDRDQAAAIGGLQGASIEADTNLEGDDIGSPKRRTRKRSTA